MVGVSIDTANFPAGEQVGAWQQILTDHLVPFHVLPKRDIPFRGRIRRNLLGPVDVAVTTRTASVNRRSQRLIAQAGDRRAALSLHLAGGDWVVSEDRSQQRIHPGDLVLWDLARPMTLASSTSISSLNLRIPLEDLVTRPERLLTSAATVLPTGRGVGTLIESHLRHLAELAGGLRPDVAALFGVATVDLLATYFAELLGEAERVDGASGRTLLRQVKIYIEAHLGEPELSPATIAAAQYISVRLLYKLFAADADTVVGWIRKRRLERVRHDLTRPAHAGSSITAIACRWGFTNSAHFSRLFKAAYGTSPSDYRRSYPTQGAPVNNRAHTVTAP